MPHPDAPIEDREAPEPTRLQRAARRGCAGLAYAIVLVPLAIGIWFFSTLPRGRDQFGYLAWNFLWEGPPGANTEIIVLNRSGHDVRLEWMRIADHETTFTGVLEAERKDDLDQKIVHYQGIFSAEVHPRTFAVEIRYTEVDTNLTRSGSFVADRRPRRRCAFLILLRPDGPDFPMPSIRSRGLFLVLRQPLSGLTTRHQEIVSMSLATRYDSLSKS